MILMLVQLCVSLVLFVIALIFKKDNHFERRNYIDVSDRSLNLNLIFEDEETEANPRYSIN